MCGEISCGFILDVNTAQHEQLDQLLPVSGHKYVKMLSMTPVFSPSCVTVLYTFNYVMLRTLSYSIAEYLVSQQ